MNIVYKNWELNLFDLIENEKLKNINVDFIEL